MKNPFRTPEMRRSFDITLLLVFWTFGSISQSIAQPTPLDSSPHTQLFTLSGDYRIDGVIGDFPTKWGGPPGTGAVVYYSFLNANSVWDPGYKAWQPDGYGVEPFNNFSTFNDYERNVARDAMRSWENETGADITFVEVQETSTTVGDIRFGWTGGTCPCGQGGWSSKAGVVPRSADVWISKDNKEKATRSYEWLLRLLVHELGHSIGLQHGPSGNTNLPGDQDHTGNTVMSYSGPTPGPGVDGSGWLYPKRYDILALNYLYGTKGIKSPAVSGNYRFYGSGKADTLTGGIGNDVFEGLDGDDIFIASTGNDHIDGGNGIDTIVFDTDRRFFLVNYGEKRVQHESGIWTRFTNIERLQFADKSIALDLDKGSSAGKAARIIGAAFGADYLTPEYMGAAIDIFDSGASLLDVSQLILDSEIFQQIVGSSDDASLVNLIFIRVLGREATTDEKTQYAKLLVGSGGSMTQAELLVEAALHSLNESNIDINKLIANGVEFTATPT